MNDLVWVRGAELPVLAVWWTDDYGNLHDLSGATSFACKIGEIGQTPLLNKTTGITGAAGSGDGTNETDVPNVVVAWEAGDLDITPGVWQIELSCLDGGLTRKLTREFVIEPTFA